MKPVPIEQELLYSFMIIEANKKVYFSTALPRQEISRARRPSPAPGTKQLGGVLQII